MAKGDDARARNQIDYQSGLAQNRLNNLWDIAIPQNQNFWNNYKRGVNEAYKDKGDLSALFKNYQETGGMTPLDESNLRNRAASSVRGIYKNMSDNVDRQRRLQGDYAPNAIATKAKLARESGSAISDALTNAEGIITAQKLAGKQFGASGAANLYSATPGMANIFGNQALNSTGQLIDLGGKQIDLGLGTERNQIAASQLPGRWEGTIGRINDILDLGKSAAGFWGSFNPGISKLH